MLNIIAAGTIALLFHTTPANASSLLHKDIWYLPEGSRPAKASYWHITLGEYDLNIPLRPLGATPSQTTSIPAKISYRMSSNGYIEATGVTKTGQKIGYEAGFGIRTGNKEIPISGDQIAYFYNFGKRIALKDGTRGDFVFIDGPNILTPKTFLLQPYYLTTYYGDDILKESTPAPLRGFALEERFAIPMIKE